MPLFTEMCPISNQRTAHDLPADCVTSAFLQQHGNNLGSGYMHAIIFPKYENNIYVKVT